MQDAYFQEKNNVGNWFEIGYSAPGTGSSYSYASNVFNYSGSSTAGVADWAASPKVDLNDCKKNTANAWKLTGTANASDGTATAFQIADASAGGAACKNLTASWNNLTRSSN